MFHREIHRENGKKEIKRNKKKNTGMSKRRTD